MTPKTLYDHHFDMQHDPRDHTSDRLTHNQGRKCTSAAATSIRPSRQSMVIIAAMSLLLVMAAAPEFYEQAYANNDSANTQQIAEHVVINEVDTNPPGKSIDRVFDWIEIHNPTFSQVDIGGWQLASTTGTKPTITIQPNTIIKPGQFLTYTNQHIRFADINEVIELRDLSGTIIDKTPKITDTSDDHRSWQRIYDGYAFNGNAADWKFSTQTPGTSNGKIPIIDNENQVVITVMTDRDGYTFGQTVSISGTVSERRFVEKPHFTSEEIILQITGPNYDNTVTLYPDFNLGFFTTLDVQQVQNIDSGTYQITAKYAGSVATTSFTVGTHQVQSQTAQESGITIAADAAAYTRGQAVTITGATLQNVPFATFKIIIEDPNGAVISDGNVMPVNGAITSTVVLNAINPTYGTYVITAEYGDHTATTSFELTPQSTYNTSIVLTADKAAYAQGQRVTINGTLSNIWTQTLDVKVLQTRQGAIIEKGEMEHVVFEVDDSVRVSEDGLFSYSFDIPNNVQSLGDYKITVAGDIISSSIVISVVNDTQSFVPSTGQLTIQTDSPSYVQNEDIIFTGYVSNTPSITTQYATAQVSIIITDDQGDEIQSYATSDDRHKNFVENSGIITYEIRAIPEESGRYTAQVKVLASVFEEGNYTAIATYQGHKAMVSFTVLGQYATLEPSISINKEVFGLGETVVLDGILPQTATSHVFVTLIKPDGSTIRSSAPIEDRHFTWEWDAPKADRKHSIKEGELCGLTLSVFGTYQLKIFTDSESEIKYFKLSEDPANDALSDTPLFVTTSKAIYKPGDNLLVSGNVLVTDKSNEELRVMPRVTIVVEKNTFPYTDIYESRVYPDNAGAFSSEFTLPIGVFTEGAYRVTASYGTMQSMSVFSMINDYVMTSDEPISIHVETDQASYSPGQTVTVTGGPNKIIFISQYDVSVAKKTGNEIDCDTFLCNVHRGPITRINPDPTASFTHQFTIPQGTDALGTYEVTVESQIGIKRVVFDVVEAQVVDVPMVETGDASETPETSNDDAPKGEDVPKELQPFVPEVIIDRHNRLSETEFEIKTYANTALEYKNGTVQASPVSLIGSVITTKGQESSVNLQVSTDNNICVIGPQDNGCMINESTRSQGKVFEVIHLYDYDDDSTTSLRVVYSGTDERLERFAIYAGSDQEFLPDTTWNVKVTSDTEDKQQPISRFYYKVTYKTIP